MIALACCGWLAAIVALVAVLRLRRRLELAADAEHELRGPVTALMLGIEAIRRAPGLRDRGEALAAELDRMRAGLADLAAAREGRRAVLEPATVPIARVARASARSWGEVARVERRAMRVNWEAGDITVAADPRRLSQALGNVLANAVEHGEGEVEIRAMRHRDQVRLEVRDEGNGVRESRARLVPRGYAPTATGRGLRIAEEAVTEVGGSLRPLPQERGAGVVIELPVAER